MRKQKGIFVFIDGRWQVFTHMMNIDFAKDIIWRLRKQKTFLVTLDFYDRKEDEIMDDETARNFKQFIEEVNGGTNEELAIFNFNIRKAENLTKQIIDFESMRRKINEAAFSPSAFVKSSPIVLSEEEMKSQFVSCETIEEDVIDKVIIHMNFGVRKTFNLINKMTRKKAKNNLDTYRIAERIIIDHEDGLTELKTEDIKRISFLAKKGGEDNA